MVVGYGIHRPYDHVHTADCWRFGESGSGYVGRKSRTLCLPRGFKPLEAKVLDSGSVWLRYKV